MEIANLELRRAVTNMMMATGIKIYRDTANGGSFANVAQNFVVLSQDRWNNDRDRNWLASTLLHEIGHLRNRAVVNQLTRNWKTQISSNNYLSGAALPTNAVYNSLQAAVKDRIQINLRNEASVTIFAWNEVLRADKAANPSENNYSVGSTNFKRVANAFGQYGDMMRIKTALRIAPAS